jgi:hypothetical protein
VFREGTGYENGCEEDGRAASGTICAAPALPTGKKEMQWGKVLQTKSKVRTKTLEPTNITILLCLRRIGYRIAL